MIFFPLFIVLLFSYMSLSFHILSQLLQVFSSFTSISLGTSSNSISSMITPIVTNIPPPVCEAHLLVASEESRSEESLVRYNLRNRAIPILGDKVGSAGLGYLITLPNPKKRSRKSHLNMAQVRSKWDVTSGKHSLVLRALRARDAQARVPP